MCSASQCCDPYGCLDQCVHLHYRRTKNPTNSIDNAGIDAYNWRILYCIFCPAVEVSFPWHDHIFLERGQNCAIQFELSEIYHQKDEAFLQRARCFVKIWLFPQVSL